MGLKSRAEFGVDAMCFVAVVCCMLVSKLSIFRSRQVVYKADKGQCTDGHVPSPCLIALVGAVKAE